MTYLSYAYRILKRSREPLTIEEIVTQALNDGMRTSTKDTEKVAGIMWVKIRNSIWNFRSDSPFIERGDKIDLRHRRDKSSYDEGIFGNGFPVKWNQRIWDLESYLKYLNLLPYEPLPSEAKSAASDSYDKKMMIEECEYILLEEIEPMNITNQYLEFLDTEIDGRYPDFMWRIVERPQRHSGDIGEYDVKKKCQGFPIVAWYESYLYGGDWGIHVSLEAMYDYLEKMVEVLESIAPGFSRHDIFLTSLIFESVIFHEKFHFATNVMLDRFAIQSSLGPNMYKYYLGKKRLFPSPSKGPITEALATAFEREVLLSLFEKERENGTDFGKSLPDESTLRTRISSEYSNRPSGYKDHHQFKDFEEIELASEVFLENVATLYERDSNPYPRELFGGIKKKSYHINPKRSNPLIRWLLPTMEQLREIVIPIYAHG
jgi:hypothetical protein